MKKEHSPKCDVVKYPTIAQACTCHKHPPVAPAPTASARDERPATTTREIEIARDWLRSREVQAVRWNNAHPESQMSQEDRLVYLLEAYASSQSSKLEGVGQEAAEKQQEKDRLIIGRIADWICGKRLTLRAAQLGQLAIALTECIEKQSNEPFDKWLKSYNDELIAGRLKP